MKLILNADDFGKSPERNQAIHDCFLKRLITAAGVIVTGRYLNDAIQLAKDGGYIDKLHIHFNLSTNLQHEGSDDVPLTEGIKADSFFCKNGIFVERALPTNWGSIFKWRIIYHELVAQYEMFKEITDGRADFQHVDFHMWFNLTLPASIALNLLSRKYDIKNIRFCTFHHIRRRMAKMCRLLSWNPSVKYIPSTNIDYFLSKQELMKQYDIMELYCHPHYKDGIFLDDSPSYLKHER